jgi:hypothetical protein
MATTKTTRAAKTTTGATTTKTAKARAFLKVPPDANAAKGTLWRVAWCGFIDTFEVTQETAKTFRAVDVRDGMRSSLHNLVPKRLVRVDSIGW